MEELYLKIATEKDEVYWNENMKVVHLENQIGICIKSGEPIIDTGKTCFDVVGCHHGDLVVAITHVYF